jgi:DNA-3-methyladenine glycosylase
MARTHSVVNACLKGGRNLKNGCHIEYRMERKRLQRDFFVRDALEVAPELLAKNLVVRLDKDSYVRYQVTEVEAYRGSEDRACHASRGRTDRTEIMYHEGGRIYVYFIYGMYWMLNVVTGEADDPQAVLIRGVEHLPGPGRLTRSCGIDGSFYGEDLVISDRIWFEDQGIRPKIKTGLRIGVEYAGEYWKTRPWRFFI